MEKISKGKLMMIAGMLLLACSLFLLFYNEWDNRRAGQEAGAILNEMDGQRSEIHAEAEQYLRESGKLDKDQLMTAKVQEKDFVGILEIPGLKLRLPVNATLNAKNIRITPCLKKGSPESGEMIIAGANYKTIFRNLRSLKEGDLISFQDITGNTYEYEVQTVVAAAAVADSSADLELLVYSDIPGNRAAVLCRKKQ